MDKILLTFWTDGHDLLSMEYASSEHVIYGSDLKSAKGYKMEKYFNKKLVC